MRRSARGLCASPRHCPKTTAGSSMRCAHYSCNKEIDHVLENTGGGGRKRDVPACTAAGDRTGQKAVGQLAHGPCPGHELAADRAGGGDRYRGVERGAAWRGRKNYRGSARYRPTGWVRGGRRADRNRNTHTECCLSNYLGSLERDDR